MEVGLQSIIFYYKHGDPGLGNVGALCFLAFIALVDHVVVVNILRSKI